MRLPKLTLPVAVTALLCVAIIPRAVVAVRSIELPDGNITVIDDSNSPTPPPETPTPTPIITPTPSPVEPIISDPIITDPIITDPAVTPAPSPTPGDVSQPETQPQTQPVATPSPVVAPPNSTTPQQLIEEGGNDEGYPGPFVKPYSPPELKADAVLLELLYLAKLNQAACRAQAQEYMDQGIKLNRRSDVGMSKRSLAGVTLCLPRWQTISATFHWIVPTTSRVEDIVQSKVLTKQIQMLSDRLADIHIAIKVEGRWIWQDKYTDPLAPTIKESMGQNAARVKYMRKKVGADAPDHLNVFLTPKVFSDGLQRLGFATRPEPNKAVKQYDGVFLAQDNMVDYEPKGDWGRPGAGLIHEVGHWLNLIHVFEGNCAGTDGVKDTRQLKGESSDPYQRACINSQGLMDANPSLIRNFMSYSSAANYTHGNFTQGQISRAHSAIYTFRRGQGTLPSYCEYQVRRRSHPRLVERAPTDLLSICDNTDLRIANVDVSDYAVKGVLSPDSPAIQVPYEQIQIDESPDLVYKGKGPGGDDGGQKGVFQSQGPADFDPYPGDVGPGSTQVKYAATSSSSLSSGGGSSTGGQSAASTAPAIGKLALAVLPLVAAGLTLF